MIIRTFVRKMKNQVNNIQRIHIFCLFLKQEPHAIITQKGGICVYRLLVVDDEAYSRDGISSLITKSFPEVFRIEKASSGMEGIRIARSFQPDLVISDVRMPRIDGLNMCRQIIECLPQVRFIFISGYSELEYYRSALKLHALSFVEKPVVPEEFIAEIERAISILDVSRVSTEINQESDESVYIRNIHQYVSTHFADPELSVAQIADALHLSRNYVGSLYKKATGTAITSYINEVRMEKAIILLQDPKNRVNEVGVLVGFDNTDYFTRKFKEYTGKTPSEFRR